MVSILEELQNEEYNCQPHFLLDTNKCNYNGICQYHCIFYSKNYKSFNKLYIVCMQFTFNKRMTIHLSETLSLITNGMAFDMFYGNHTSYFHGTTNITSDNFWRNIKFDVIFKGTQIKFMKVFGSQSCTLWMCAHLCLDTHIVAHGIHLVNICSEIYDDFHHKTRF